MTEEPKIKTHREVTRKDNYFSISVRAGETYTVAVNGEIVVTVNMGDDCTVNSYVKRESIPMQYKE